MPYTTIKDPGTAKLFNVFGGMFVPNVNAQIEGDLNAKRRDMLIAQTQGQNLENAKLQAANDARRRVGEFLAGNPDLTMDQNRASLMSILSGMDNGLQYGPQFATGSATFINPNFAGSESDFSKTLVGTGVVGNFAATPEGQRRDNAATMDRQNSVNAAAAARQVSANEAAAGRQTSANQAAYERAVLAQKLALDRFLAGQTAATERSAYAQDAATQRATAAQDAAAARQQTALASRDVSPEQVDALWAATNERLQQQYGTDNIDPALVDALRLRASEAYQTSRNAERAIAEALSGVPVQYNDGWFSDSLSLGQQPQAPAPAATPAASAGAAQSAPITATDKQGNKIMFDGTKWVPVPK